MDTPAPAGQLFKSNPSDYQYLGAGHGASTLRALVRYVRNFLQWLTSARQKVYPSEEDDLVCDLKTRCDEPSNRGALKNVKSCFAFFEEVTCYTRFAETDEN